MQVCWSDAVEAILAGDQAVMLGSVTPAHGVVLTPVTNFATHDRHTGRVSVNSSVGAGRKLARMRGNPHVALAFHTREHSLTDRPEYVLVQGKAEISQPVRDFPSTLGENWERFDGPLGGALWKRWMRVYYTRASIDITVHRVLVWPDLLASGEPATHGTSRPGQPPPVQRPPTGGTGPRVDCAQVARSAARLPTVLLGWEDTDGFPLVVPVMIEDNDDHGIHLRTAYRDLPPGGRRSGLTAHAFTRHVIGQHQRVHTGWLATDTDQRGALFAPHTSFGYRMPASMPLYRLIAGFATRRGARIARRSQST
jgi:hypothetical protein